MNRNRVDEMKREAEERLGPHKKVEDIKPEGWIEPGGRVDPGLQFSVGDDSPVAALVVTSDGEIVSNWPKPRGWRILVDPMRPMTMSRGGILLPDEAKRAQEYLQHIGQVVAMGPLCYRHAKFEGGEPWCKVGDWIAYGQYSGQAIIVRNDEKRAEAQELSDKIVYLAQEYERLQHSARLAESSDAIGELKAKMDVIGQEVSEYRAQLGAAQADSEHRLRVINDDEVLAVLPDPNIVRVYV